MLDLLYKMLVIVTSPLWGLWLLWRLVGQRKDRRAFHQRWRGVAPDALPPDAMERTPRIWIHAVSVGEVMAVVPLVKALRRDHPQALLVGSTVTDPGQETMKTKLPELDAVCYLPYDLGWSVRRTLESIRPTLFLFAETELWPTLLLALHRRGVPAIMVNGRVSERSVRRYQWIGPFIRRVVRSLDALAVQREADRGRLIRLGADPARVMVCGNLKADGAVASTGDTHALKRTLGLGTERLIIAGSTHHPEERMAANAFLETASTDASVRLCIAPRHLDRCEAIAAELGEMGLSTVKRSRLPASGRSWTDAREIVLLDTMGELATGYELASVVIMGGTFAPIGGHNLLEPAATGRAVLFGPHTGQWTAVADELAAVGGAVGVTNATTLGEALRRVLTDDAERHGMGEAARAYVRSQQGATARTMSIITRVLKGEQPSAVRSESTTEDGITHTSDRRAVLSAWLWKSGARDSMLKRLLSPAAWGYGAVMAVRRRWYRHGWLTSTRLPVQVISVGNLTVGGSGKTPVVITLANLIGSTGCPVGVVTRGYLGVRSDDPCVVSDGREIRATVEEAGDEAMLLAKWLARVPIAVGRDRAAAIRLLLAQTPPGRQKPKVVIVDDGFQHLKLHRDLNLLVIDGSRPALDQRLLPCGPLRESWSAVRDASAAVVVDRSGTATPGAAEEQPLCDRLRENGFNGPLFLARMRPTGLIALPSGDPLPLARLSGAEVAICSGIGHPESFRDTVARAGARIVREWVFQDHHHYAPHEVEMMIQEARRLGAAMLLTTEKDAVKLAFQPVVTSGGGFPVAALRVTLTIEPESDWHRWLAQHGVLAPAASRSDNRNPSAGPDHSTELFCGSSPRGAL